jgi:gliding motility-associated-like protein
LPTAPAQPAYCVGDVPLGPVVASGVNLLWYSTLAGGTGTPTAPTPTTNSDGEQVFYVSQTIPPNGCESGRLPVIVNVNPLPTVSAGPDRRINLGESVLLQGIALGNGVDILWSPNNNLSNPKIPRPTASPLIDITYNITVVTADGCVGSDNVTVVVLQPIDIPNVFSPNGDGVHDLWIIDKIDQYPNCVVEVYNRYGTKLFERKGYNSSNAWDGTNKGAPLPVGPYYYIVRLGDNSKARAGVVSIVR